MSRISIRGLTKRFGSVVAVNNVSLDLKDGEIFGLLGPSGSGKTTLMRCIAGFVAQDAGTIEVDSINLTGIPTYQRNIGMVFQNYALFPHMTVFDNVAFSLRVKGVSVSERRGRVSDMLAMVQLAGFENRLPRELSGGQQQRVALARALISNPRVLLLDEPLNALDRHLRQQMQIELKQIQRNVGITTVFVTHDQDEALSLCDRIAIFKEGNIAQLGTPIETYERPTTRFAAEFLGAANLFEGKIVSKTSGDYRIVLNSGDEIRSTDPMPAAGKAITAVVRPEKLVISSLGESERQGTEIVNRLAGTVDKLIYLGSSINYVVRTTCGELTVFQQNASNEPLQSGTRVIVWWSPRHTVLLNSF